MRIASHLSLLALQEVITAACATVGIDVDAVGEFLTERFLDHSQRLSIALHVANDRAWKTLEIALAGDSLWQRCKNATARAEDRAFAQQLRAFLDAAPLPEQANQAAFRPQCLQELRAARKANLLCAKSVEPRQLAAEAGLFARLRDKQSRIDAEWRAVLDIGGALREFGYPNLAHLLSLRPQQGDPLLVAAARYYFHRAVEEDAKLFQGLAFAKLEALGSAQEIGFAALAAALTQQGQQVEDLLADVQGVVVQTHGAVLDLQHQLAGQGQQLQQLGEAVGELLAQRKMQSREVRPGDSLSIRNDTERQLIKQLIARYRSLPDKERQSTPALLNAIGKLEMVAGDFDAAVKDFQSAAVLTADGPTQAEAHFNAFQAALERRDLAGAMKAFLAAVQLDGNRYAPFPVATYNPLRILGAGGFGTAFLCRHRYMNADVVVKVFRMDGLGRDADAVFTEAQVLRRLDHPAIIRITECGYAEETSKNRPFLIMDYFAGETLEEHVQKHGVLKLPDLLAVGKQVAEGLQAAHGAKILHRDVKPANLLVRREGQGWKVKIIDFGLAVTQQTAKESLGGERSRARQTLLGASIAGTLEYAAPEQLGRRSEPVGPYSDIYGWAKTCSFSLFKTTQPLRSHWNSLPEALAALLEKCLTEDPWHRPRDMAEVIKTLSGLSGTARDFGERKSLYRFEKAALATAETQDGETYRVRDDRERQERERPGPDSPARRDQQWREPEPPVAEPIVRPRRTSREDSEHESRRASWQGIVRQIPVWGWLVAGVGVLAVLGGLMQIAMSIGGRKAPSQFGFPGTAEQTAIQFEPVPPEDLRPSADDPEASRVYLSDLQEVDVKAGAWQFGKNGNQGDPFNNKIKAHGQTFAKAIFTHPSSNDYTGVKYNIEPAETLQTFVGIADSSGGAHSDVTFEVWGDRKQLWKSKTVRKPRAFQACRVSIRGVKVLELRAYASGFAHHCHATWIDPYIVRKAMGGPRDQSAVGPPAKSDSAKQTKNDSAKQPELFVPVPPGTRRREKQPASARLDPPRDLAIPHVETPITSMPGLIGYWPFDDKDTDSVWTAELSNRNHGRLEGKVSRTAGVFGKALTFTGRDSYLNYGNYAQYNFPANASFTYAIWVKTKADSGNIISQRHSMDDGAAIGMSLEAQGTVRMVVRGNGVIFEDSVYSRARINNGKWHHCAMVRDGAVLRLYIDGVQQGEKRTAAVAEISTDMRGLAVERRHLLQGRDGFLGVKSFLEGSLDEFCIFNRALKVDEIAMLAKKP